MCVILIRSVVCLAAFWSCFNYTSEAEFPEKALLLQRPVVEYLNSSYARIYNMTSRRYNRQDPLYYLNIFVESYVALNKHYNVHIRVDEFLSYTSKRRFIDLDFDMCTFLSLVANRLLYKRKIFDSFVQINFEGDCIIPIGYYNLHNLTWPADSAPFSIPFLSGRLELNFSSNRGFVLCSAYIDLDLKTIRKKKL